MRTLAALKKKVETFDTYDQVRNEYRRLAEYTRTLKFDVDQALKTGLDEEAKLYLCGKRMLEVLKKFMTGDEVLKCAIEDDVDLTSIRGEEFDPSDTVVLTSFESRSS